MGEMLNSFDVNILKKLSTGWESRPSEADTKSEGSLSSAPLLLPIIVYMLYILHHQFLNNIFYEHDEVCKAYFLIHDIGPTCSLVLLEISWKRSHTILRVPEKAVG